jgi:hypothetical protein
MEKVRKLIKETNSTKENRKVDEFDLHSRFTELFLIT